MRESFYTVAGCPVSLAIVSDLHERPFEKALASLERNRPALICIPGVRGHERSSLNLS